MHGNYRHHYLLMPASAGSQSTPVPATPPTSATRSASRQQVATQMANNFNGLPVAGGKHSAQVSTGNYSISQQQQQLLHKSQEFQDRSAEPTKRMGGRYFDGTATTADQQQQQHHLQLHQQVRAPNRPGLAQHNNIFNADHHNLLQQKYLAQQYEDAYYNGDHDDDDGSDTHLSNGHHNRDIYASQLRNSKLQHNYQQQQQHQQQQQAKSRQLSSSASMQQQQQQVRGSTSAGHASRQPLAGKERPRAHSPASSSSASPQSAGSGHLSQQYSHNNNNNTSGSSSGSSSKSPVAARETEQRSLHVNFNRHSQSALEADEDEGDSRKKKYLTAKYGQQQMNLIKKRLKIEMWLCEQLKALAEGTRSEAELEEIDIDLDLLLDMEDDETRRRWLKKTLEPFEDLPRDRLEKFICDVLEQSKLL